MTSHIHFESENDAVRWWGHRGEMIHARYCASANLMVHGEQGCEIAAIMATAFSAGWAARDRHAKSNTPLIPDALGVLRSSLEAAISHVDKMALQLQSPVASEPDDAGDSS